MKNSKRHQDDLHKKWEEALINARKEATKWHKAEKKKRIEQSQVEAKATLNNLNLYDDSILELSLAMLYIGEGSKANEETALGNSDPFILKFFITALKNIYGIKTEQMKCEIHIRKIKIPSQ